MENVFIKYQIAKLEKNITFEWVEHDFENLICWSDDFDDFYHFLSLRIRIYDFGFVILSMEIKIQLF